MIQTTIQNSCAVDNYKKSWNICLTARCSVAVRIRHTPVSFPRTTTVMRAATHVVHCQKETCKKKKKKKIRMGKGERKEKRNAFQLYTEVVPPRIPASWGLSYIHHVARGCLTGRSSWGRLFAFLVFLSAMTKPKTPLPDISPQREQSCLKGPDGSVVLTVGKPDGWRVP